MSNDAPTTGGPSPAKSIQDFFGWVRGFGIYRPNEDRWVAGVAVGLSRRWGIDPILVRGIFVALTFAGGLGVAAYGIAWLLLPQQDGRIHLQEAVHGHFTAGFVGAVLLSLALFGDPGWSGDHWFAGPPRFLAAVFLIGLIWWMHRHRDAGWRYQGASGAPMAVPPPAADATTSPVPPATPAASVPDYGTPMYRTAGTSAPVPPPPGMTDGPAGFGGARPPAWVPPEPRLPDPSRASKRVTRVTLGLALIIGAVVGFVSSSQDSWNQNHSAGLVGFAAALAVIGAGVVWAGFSGRRSGGLAFLGFIIGVAVLIGAGVQSAGVRSGQVTQLAGDYTWMPSTPTMAAQQYNLGVGEAELRLTDPAILASATAANPLRVSVRMGAGHLTVVTPDGVPATVDVKLGAGDLYGPNGQTSQSDPGQRFNNDSNHNVQQTTHLGPSGAAVLVVDVKQGAGQIDLSTAPATSTNGTPSTPASPAVPTTPTPSAASSSKEKTNA